MRRNDQSYLLLSILLLFGYHPQSTLSLTNLPAGVDITEDTPGQVTINGDPTGNTTAGPNLPITATIFSGVPGPSTCRGRVILQLNLPPPPPHSSSSSETTTTTTPTKETCYSLPQPAGCGNFLASKDAGCEVRLFSERDCKVYVNTAVFIPEDRAVGGVWRSLAVRCGVPAPDPEALGPPPLVGLMKTGRAG